MSSRPHHRRSISSPPTRTTHTSTSDPAHHSYSTTAVPPSANNAASRIMSSVKRSLANSSSKKRWSDPQKPGMSPERDPSSRFRQPDPSFSRPTVEQIAMGLHVSRTPHLRPLRSSHAHHMNFHDTPPRRATSPLMLPPPPPRSSLKKPPTSNSTSSTGVGPLPTLSPASASSSTVASNAPSTPHSSNRSLMSFKTRMSRFLPGSRAVSAPSSLSSSPLGSTADLQAPRKAVRFSMQAAAVKEDDDL